MKKPCLDGKEEGQGNSAGRRFLLIDCLSRSLNKAAAQPGRPVRGRHFSPKTKGDQYQMEYKANTWLELLPCERLCGSGLFRSVKARSPRKRVAENPPVILEKQ